MYKSEWLNSKNFKMLNECEYYIDDFYMLSGIYSITNKVNGKLYIGKSVDVVKRINTHKQSLRKGSHYNEHLQRAWNKYGEDSFEFETLEFVEVEHLTYFENYYMELYKSYNYRYGYNSALPSEDLTHYVASSQTKEKLSKAIMKYEEDELLSFLHEFYYHNGRVPTSRELKKENGHPSRGTYDNKFGNLKNALIKANLYDSVESNYLYERKAYTKDDILEKFKTFISKNNRFPNSSEINKDNDLVNMSTLIRYFGSIGKLKEELNISKEDIKNKENEDALKSLRTLYLNEGVLSSRLIDSSRITRCAKFYRDRFGSMKAACELAGVEYGTSKK